jgi:PhoD related phosphatase
MSYLSPLLKLQQATATSWTISILLLSKENSLPTWLDKSTQQVKLSAWNLLHQDQLPQRPVYFYQASIECALQNKKSNIVIQWNYEGQVFKCPIQLPAKNTMPRMTYSSCNGFSNANIANKWKEKKNTMWQKLNSLHQQPNQAFELILMGGDQIYADALLSVKESFRLWTEKSQKEQIKATFTQTMDDQAKQFYLDWYIKSWSDPLFNNILSTVPYIMMWDDHDIIDGWGSYPPEVQNSPVHQGLYKHAEFYFCLFQQHRLPQQALNQTLKLPNKNKSEFYTFGEAALLALDLRSERHHKQIISQETWKILFTYVEAQLKAAPVKHLLIMSSLPVAHPDFNLLENLLGIIPFRQETEDDLRDHWSSREHQDERKYLVHQLLMWAAHYHCRITILSGDVHIAANGLIQSKRNNNASINACSINQITSSGIVHPPPSAMILFTLNNLMQQKWDIDRDITVEMLNMPNIKNPFVASRNFVTIQSDQNDVQKGMEVFWHVEGEDYPLKKWIRPCECDDMNHT